MRISDWSSDVCSSDLAADQFHVPQGRLNPRGGEPALVGEFDRKTRISGFRPHSQNGAVPRSPGSAMNRFAHTTPKTPTERDPRWAAVLARDPSANDRFVYAVRTTGVYCRPGSPSRLPRPENVEFFDTPAAAEEIGRANV